MKRGLLTRWSEDVMGFHGRWALPLGILAIVIIGAAAVALVKESGDRRREEEWYRQARVEWTQQWQAFKRHHRCQLIAVQTGSAEEVRVSVYKGREKYRSNPQETWMCEGVKIIVRSGFVPTQAEQHRLTKLISESRQPFNYYRDPK